MFNRFVVYSFTHPCDQWRAVFWEKVHSTRFKLKINFRSLPQLLHIGTAWCFLGRAAANRAVCANKCKMSHLAFVVGGGVVVADSFLHRDPWAFVIWFCHEHHQSKWSATSSAISTTAQWSPSFWVFWQQERNFESHCCHCHCLFGLGANVVGAPSGSFSARTSHCAPTPVLTPIPPAMVWHHHPDMSPPPKITPSDLSPPLTSPPKYDLSPNPTQTYYPQKCNSSPTQVSSTHHKVSRPLLTCQPPLTCLPPLTGHHHNSQVTPLEMSVPTSSVTTLWLVTSHWHVTPQKCDPSDDLSPCHTSPLTCRPLDKSDEGWHLWGGMTSQEGAMAVLFNLKTTD